LLLQRLDERLRQHGASVLLSLAVSDDDLSTLEIDVFDTEPNAFHQAQTRTINQGGHEVMRAARLPKQLLELHGRKTIGKLTGRLARLIVARSLSSM
jgi:hypothetical protein